MRNTTFSLASVGVGRSPVCVGVCVGAAPKHKTKRDYSVGQMALGHRDPKAKLGAEKLRSFGQFEKNAGYTQPYRETYIHNRCGTIHRLQVKDAEAFATAPTHFRYVHCDRCGDWFRPNEFVWNDGKGTKLGSRIIFPDPS